MATLLAANNYAVPYGSTTLPRSQVAAAQNMPVARRVLGESNELTLNARWYYAVALYCPPAPRWTISARPWRTLEDADPIARRVLGGAHPLTEGLRAICETREPRSAPAKTPSLGS